MSSHLTRAESELSPALFAPVYFAACSCGWYSDVRHLIASETEVEALSHVEQSVALEEYDEGRRLVATASTPEARPVAAHRHASTLEGARP
jgi:hypothetical protein